jgi:hypothetical protein
MKITELLTEAATQTTSNRELEAFKATIASRIKELPPDDATIKALKEIEDLLKHVHAGGKMGIINGELQRIEDHTVTAAQKLLARYIMSLDMTPEQREELFTLWRSDNLVNRKKLITPGKHSFNEIINKYDTNPVIKELVNELMRMATLGQGKGEFGLNVLSKNISKPEGKGDLLIDGKKIEAKTTDGGAGRFTDQEVRPGNGFEAAARALKDFINNSGVLASLPPKAVSTINESGLSLTYAIMVADLLDKKVLTKYYSLLEKLINLIFNSTQPTAPIMQAIKAGNLGAAQQQYVRANFNYYMSMKDDEGVLYINLTKEPITTVFFRNADELAKSGLRLHAGTAYMTSIADHRLPYPQTEIVDTTFGANARAKAEKNMAKSAKATTEPKAKSPVDIRPTAAKVARGQRGVAPEPQGRSKRNI